MYMCTPNASLVDGARHLPWPPVVSISIPILWIRFILIPNDIQFCDCIRDLLYPRISWKLDLIVVKIDSKKS